MEQKVVSLQSYKSKKTVDKKLASGDPEEIGKLYSEDLTAKFNTIINEQRRKKKDERTKPNT